MNEKQVKTDFFSMYHDMDVMGRRELRRRIADATEVEWPSVYNWLKRKQIPKWHQAKIAELLGIPRENLFPPIHRQQITLTHK